MSLAYRLMYRLGFAPWDRAQSQELQKIVSGAEALPPGRALDMGSGLGTKAIFLASNGWKVTAVENVPRAQAEARKRAARAGVAIDFVQGDVTRLQDLNLEPGFDLVFDFGCFHGLNARQRDAYARGVNQVAGSGATLLMMAFTRALPPIPSGVSEAELLQRFGAGWKAVWVRAASGQGTAAMANARAAWFRMQRTA